MGRGEREGGEKEKSREGDDAGVGWEGASSLKTLKSCI